MVLCHACGGDNPPGSRFCRNVDCNAFLGWQESAAAEPEPPGTGAASDGRVDPASPGHRHPPQPLPQDELVVPVPVGGDPDERHLIEGAMRSRHDGRALYATLTPTAHTVAPGEEVVYTVQVRNTGDHVERVIVDAVGLPAGWVTVVPPSVNIDCDREDAVTLRVRPPRLATTPPGPAPFSVIARSAGHPHVRCAIPCRLVVGSFEDLTLATRQTEATSRGRRGATFAIDLHNRGNAASRVRVVATGSAGVYVRCTPERVDIAPGSSTTASVIVRPKGRHLVGSAESHTCNVSVDGPRQALPAAPLTLRQRAWLPALVGRVLPALAALTLALVVVIGKPWWDGRSREIPDVVGVAQEEASAKLAGAGFEAVPRVVPSGEPAGQVLKTDPPAGASRRAGTQVRIDVSAGPVDIPVPEVRDMTYADAVALLEAQGFNVVDATARPEPTGIVTEQAPNAGDPAAPGSNVTLTVGAST